MLAPKHDDLANELTGLFEGDLDLDMVGDIAAVVDHDMFEDDPTKMEATRQKLDKGLGAKLIAEHIAREQDPTSVHGFFDPRYQTLLLVAYMMHLGAKIDEETIKHAKHILEPMASTSEYRLPIFDPMVRDAGKAQLTAALCYYKDGQPRDFHAPSCFKCGKIVSDLNGRPLRRCAGCRVAWYCNRDCQRYDWQTHKTAICQRLPRTLGGRADGPVLLNV